MTASPVRFESRGPMLLAGLRRRHPLAAAESGIALQWRELLSLGELPGRVGSSYYGVMCGSDASGIEYMCAVEVESFAGLAEGAGRMRVPAQSYAVFAYDGAPSTLRSTWERAFEWLSRGDYESAHRPDFEWYGPGSDPLGAIGAIEVWVGVVPRSAARRTP